MIALLLLGLGALALSDTSEAPEKSKHKRLTAATPSTHGVVQALPGWDLPSGVPRPHMPGTTGTQAGPGPVGQGANTGWGPQFEVSTVFVVDHQPKPGEYKQTTVGGLNLFGVIVEKRQVDLGFPENHIPAPDFISEVYSGNRPIKVEATVEVRSRTSSNTNLSPNLSDFKDRCVVTKFAGEVGFNLGVEDVPLADVWRMGTPPPGATGKTKPWSAACGYGVGGNVPRLSCSTLPGGSRRLVLVQFARRSHLRIAINLRVRRRLNWQGV